MYSLVVVFFILFLNASVGLVAQRTQRILCVRMSMDYNIYKYIFRFAFFIICIFVFFIILQSN